MLFLTAMKYLATISYGTRVGTVLDSQQVWGLLAPMLWWQCPFTAMLPCAGTAVCADLM